MISRKSSQATAEAMPRSRTCQPSSQRYIVRVWYCRSEPPRAGVVSKSRGSVKICSPPMVEVMITKITVGRISGTVSEMKRRTRPAPSSAADS